MIKFYYFFPIFLFYLININNSHAQEKIGIEEKLGSQIPLDLIFNTSEGSKTSLKEIITKPTILYFVYFHCTGLCNPLQAAVADGISRLKLDPGQDFNILTVCFDHNATQEEAKSWMNNTKEIMKRHIPNGAWNVLYGDSVSIQKLTDAAGFYFKPDGRGDFIHSGAILTLSPEGKVSRYLYFDKVFNPFDIKMALFEAGKGETNPAIRGVLQYCFSYDPKGKTYVFNTTKVIGSIMLLGVGAFFTYLVISERKKRKINN